MKRRDFLRYGAFGLAAAAVPSTLERAGSVGAAGLGEIVQCVIHPAIGIARVGNSVDEYFIGPEAPGPHPTPVGGFKDRAGRIKRQAARFRIYGLDAAGAVVREITAEEATITWTVHLANKKAAWYEFEFPFDVPEAMGRSSQPDGLTGPPLITPRRNATVVGEDRDALTIDPGPRDIAGAGINSDGGDRRFAFDTGRFFNISVPLGELRTDGAGRLLVLGGMGTSGPAVPGVAATTFANNDGWYDDTSDGPIEATVRIDGRTFQAEGAWVVVAPPNYAPGIQSIVTLYDLLFETATRIGGVQGPGRPSFTRQIYPLLERHVAHQWVNAGFLRDFGWGAPGSFTEPGTLARLADPSPDSRFLRNDVFRRFRDPRYVREQYDDLPPYYGDTTAFPPVGPRQWMAVLPNQYAWMRQWADGDFEADWPEGGLRMAERLEDLPLEDRRAALDRAALDECLGGPFHPGCEITWPARRVSMYTAPFRFRRRPEPEPDWGDSMTSEIALGASGPLTGSGPGDITRWMAVPWQTDTSSCLSGYIPAVDQYLPTFWPARVPNDVLSMQSYRTVLDTGAPLTRRQAAFRERIKWLREMPRTAAESRDLINRFVRDWGRYGVIARQPAPGDSAFPDEFWVEVGYDAG